MRKAFGMGKYIGGKLVTGLLIEGGVEVHEHDIKIIPTVPVVVEAEQDMMLFVNLVNKWQGKQAR